MKQFVLLMFVVAVSLTLTGCSPFKAKNAGLQVITSDIPSSVFLDGQYLEKTPFIGKAFKPGEYVLRIQPDDTNLSAYETNIKLTKGLLTVLTWKPGDRPETSSGVIYEMEKLASTKQTELSIISLPDGAIVSLDGAQKQFTPILIDAVEPGQHEFEVSLPSYETQKHTINVIAGHRMNITVKLAKITLELVEPSPSPVQTATPSAELTASPSANLGRQAVSQQLINKNITILPTNFFVDGQQILRVRETASPSAQEIGQAQVGNKYPYLNETYNGWHKIQFNDKIGWVNGQYSQLE